jgi:predicted pyridoxine 5'-phosphate oxidase superfamily flavin-nucleotide-binding protein
MMTMLTSTVKEFVSRQKLGFVATVCADGTPNLSPKGTLSVWDDDHLVFLDICSPGTVSNLLQNPSVEINMVDVFIRKGFRFKGTAEVISDGDLFKRVIASYGEVANKYRPRHVILVCVERVLEVFSPAYDVGATEEELRQRYMKYWSDVHGF